MSSRSRSDVLSNDDLVGEILVRVGSPASLLRAALVARKWFRSASCPAVYRQFLERLPPRLFGFYVTGNGMQRPEFVLPPTPSAPEISTAADLAATFGFDDFPANSAAVLDCRNGRVLYEFGPVEDDRIPAVRAPLSDEVALLLPPMFGAWPDLPEQEDDDEEEPLHTHAMLLPDDPDDDASCYRLDVAVSGESVAAQVSVLRPGAWTVHCTISEELCIAPGNIAGRTLLAGGKMYMVTAATYILGLDLATKSFFVVYLPEGVVSEYDGNLVLGRADDSSVLYLVHVKEGEELKVWVRRMHGQGADAWVLRDTVSLRDTCGHLLGEDGHLAAEVVGVAENAEFVFMELSQTSGVVVCMHLGSRRVEKVYQRDLEQNDMMIQVHPFYIFWNPITFPVLEEKEGEE